MHLLASCLSSLTNRVSHLAGTLMKQLTCSSCKRIKYQPDWLTWLRLLNTWANAWQSMHYSASEPGGFIKMPLPRNHAPTAAFKAVRAKFNYGAKWACVNGRGCMCVCWQRSEKQTESTNTWAQPLSVQILCRTGVPHWEANEILFQCLKCASHRRDLQALN